MQKLVKPPVTESIAKLVKPPITESLETFSKTTCTC